MITVQSVDRTAPKSVNDEGALRFWSFDSDIRLELGGWQAFEFRRIPALQFFRSLFKAIDDLERVSFATWEIFDTGTEFNLQRVDGNVVWKTSAQSTVTTCALSDLVQEAAASWSEAEGLILQAHPAIGNLLKVNVKP